MDAIGVSWFMFNFVIEQCQIGININYTTITDMQLIDNEIGDFRDCGTSVNLQQTGSGRQAGRIVLRREASEAG